MNNINKEGEFNNILPLLFSPDKETKDLEIPGTLSYLIRRGIIPLISKFKGYNL